MRPLNLKLNGFTSFRDEQELDFRTLDVFVVTGPTGAGKSSLLDAMTYALYGEVERVGRECGQLVSHGATRMAVTLEFEVAGNEYRITRTTPAKTGPTKVLLERIVDGAARSYGEGADRVRECNEHVKQLIGLDYEGFTRSVLLPQGKFAEFMAGKPDERRAIMSDLLGLGLFKRMAQRAGRLASDCESAANVKQRLLQTEYANVTPEALAAAQVLAASSKQRVVDLEKASKAVGALAEKWRFEQLRSTELRTCAVDLRTWRTRVAAAVTETEALARQLADNVRDLAAAAATREAAGLAATSAAAEVQAAEANWGTALELAPALSTARRLPTLAQQLAARQRELDDLAARQPISVAALTAATDAHRAALESVVTAEVELEAARQHERDIEHANMAAALASGLQVGDPCPVCAEPLQRLPERPAAEKLTHAERARKTAEKALAAAQQAGAAAVRLVERTQRDIEEAEKARLRLTTELAQQRRDHAAAELELATALRGPVPPDPAGVLGKRIAELQAFSERAQSAGAAQARLLQVHSTLIHAGDLFRQRIAHQRSQLEDGAEALLTRAVTALGGASPLPEWPPVPDQAATPTVLLQFGHAKMAAVDTFTADLDKNATASAAAESRLIDSARQAIGELVASAPNLAATVEALVRASTAAIGQQASATRNAEVLTTALEKRRALEAEIAEHRTQSGRYQALATDLRADRLIAFLQDEALATLAEAGSRHLDDLSGQRYGLEVDRDFFVVDRWHADEKRSVRTLSGGETFLASLALALALSEQVRALSVTEGAQLDSLFLDEGFGSLDPDALRTVVEAIEKLSGGGRLVGLITHICDLAEQFQRVEVEKSPRGSRLQVVA